MIIIVKSYDKNYNGIEVINRHKLEEETDYIKSLYNHRKIKKPYATNIGNDIIFYAKKEFTKEIINRIKEHNTYFKKKEQKNKL